jgi:hypothetical protein
MSDLSRNLLEAAREGLSPDAAAMARVRAKVAASVAASATAVTATTVNAVAVPAKATTGLGVKLGIGVLVVAALGGAIIATQSRRGADSARIAITSSDRDEAHDVVRVSSAEARVTTTPVTARPVRKSTPAVAAAPKQPPAPAAAPPSEPISLSREVELIDRAMLLVRRGDARDAIGVIATYERETRGQGQMAEDASAIEIEARCRLHEDASGKLSAFDRRWPSSAQRSRLQTLCFARK